MKEDIESRMNNKKCCRVKIILPLVVCLLLSLSFGKANQGDMRQRIETLLLNRHGKDEKGRSISVPLKEMGKPAIAILMDIVKENRYACAVKSTTYEKRKGCWLLKHASNALGGRLKATDAADLILSVLLDPQNSKTADIHKMFFLEDLKWIGNRKHLTEIKKFVHYTKTNTGEKDDSYSVRRQAIETITSIGDEREIPFLEKVRKSHPDKYTRGFAEEAIKKIKQKKKQK